MLEITAHDYTIGDLDRKGCPYPNTATKEELRRRRLKAFQDTNEDKLFTIDDQRGRSNAGRKHDCTGENG